MSQLNDERCSDAWYINLAKLSGLKRLTFRIKLVTRKSRSYSARRHWQIAVVSLMSFSCQDLTRWDSTTSSLQCHDDVLVAMVSTWILMLIVVDAAVPRLHAATAGKPLPRRSPRIHISCYVA